MPRVPQPSPAPPRRPEILAPAGDAECLRAALRAGADAVYFGLQEGFNARARAGNFALENLAETVAEIHQSGARAYLTLNTLIFEPELAAVERVLRQAAAAGIDAVLVQDPAVALIARAAAPQLVIHASTQMTISSGDAAAFAAELGARRVVLPRELSVDEIGRFLADARASGNPIEVEVFIHGALCVAWSGQCLTSAAWGGRSANRGQCAQSCRMPYELIVDGQQQPLGDVQYLLSPKDLAGIAAVPQLVELGVHGLKIEGRQKGAQYVATATAGYRRWVDAVAARGQAGSGRAANRVEGGPAASDTQAQQQLSADLQQMSLAFSRGFGAGFLSGSDHQSLVEGRFPKHRGIYLGRVARVRDHEVLVEVDPEGRPWTGALGLPRTQRDPARAAGAQGQVLSPLQVPAAVTHALAGANARDRVGDFELRAGMGVVFDAGHPEEKDEPGGPVFRVDRIAGGWRLGFGAPGPDLRRVQTGQRVWVTSDPTNVRAQRGQPSQGTSPSTIAASGSNVPSRTGRVALALRVEGRPGEALRVTARIDSHGTQPETTVTTATALVPARGLGLGEPLLRDKLGALGGTPFRLQSIDLHALEPGLHVPVSELKAVRRELVEALLPHVELAADADSAATAVLGTSTDAHSGTLATIRAQYGPPPRSPQPTNAAPALIPLCRSDAQLAAVIQAGLPEVELDWMEMVGLARAVEQARAAGLRVTVATLRVQKPGEESFDSRIARLNPDGVLVRHWGGVVWFARHASERGTLRLHGDFSLNVTNSITAGHLLRRGLDTLTAAHDLDESQLFALLEHAPPERFTMVLHHHIATFHTEHCVYAHLLSNGRDYRTCGRPCEAHEVGLRDHRQQTHPVIVDAGCRNTVFNAHAQSAAPLVPRLLERGVRRFRVEFVRESHAEAVATLRAYNDLLAGRAAGESVLRALGVQARQGVAEQPMALLL